MTSLHSSITETNIDADWTDMNCEQLRIQKNRAYLEYEREEDITQKRLKQEVWKNLVAQYEDAYRQEILGDHSVLGFGTEGMTEADRERWLTKGER